MTTTLCRERPVLEAARRAILAAPRPLLPMRRRSEFEKRRAAAERFEILGAATRLIAETNGNERRDKTGNIEIR